ncbi:MAG: sugar phosphate isomerase/epimerase [Sphaerochaetaceae bacterium]
MIRISSSSNIHQIYGSNDQYFSIFDSIEALSLAGFDQIDLTWASYSKRGCEFAGPQWKAWVERIGECLESHKMQASQSHAVFYLHTLGQEELRFNELMVERAMEASSMLSIPWTVMHILRVRDIECSDKAIGMEKNVEYFKGVGELARKHGSPIAIENGLTGFYHSASELLELLSRLNDPIFGLCWDTGHANITGQDQGQAIRQMGKCLKALHINDNDGIKDLHQLPGLGNLDFKPILKALKDIGFDGPFTYECPKTTKDLLPEVRSEALKLAYAIAQSMIKEIS